jgi:hypothetical protein
MKRLIFVFVTSILIVYGGLFFYGRKAITPRNQALTLISEANNVFPSNNPPLSLTEENTLMKTYVSLYEQASHINLRQYPILDDDSILEAFIKENYQLSKDILSYEEQLFVSNNGITQADYDEALKGFGQRRTQIYNQYGSYGRTHLWMKLIFLK